MYVRECFQNSSLQGYGRLFAIRVWDGAQFGDVRLRHNLAIATDKQLSIVG